MRIFTRSSIVLIRRWPPKSPKCKIYFVLNYNLNKFSFTPKRYRSLYSKDIKKLIKDLKKSAKMQHKTFGLPDETLTISPDKFLKKDEGIQRYYERPKTSHVRCTSRKPPIPKHNELNKAISMQTLDYGDKNFKLINIERAKSAGMAANKPAPKCFEQKAPVYIYRSKYGKVPKYLERLKETNEKLRELKMKEEEEKNEKDRNQIRVIDQEEKKKLLDGLKYNWQKLQEEYQKMPLLIDSVPKMIRKTKLEINLKSLEQDICLLNKNSNRIFILPDQKENN